MFTDIDKNLNVEVFRDNWPKVKEMLMFDYEMLESGIKAFIEKPAKIVSYQNDNLVLEFANDNFKELFEKDYQLAFEACYSEILGKKITTSLITSSEKDRFLSELEKNNEKENNISPDYTFDNFVNGNSNQYAYSASVCVASNPGEEYNPLFIYGGTGLGKTHLLYAIANKIKKEHPDFNIVYVDCNDFVNEFVSSLQNKKMDEFKNKFYNADVLLVDDIQQISSKPSTMEEFFNTFNKLDKKKKQIVIVSDLPPKDLDLNERLISRFVKGLTCEINSPDYETRYAILLKKQEKEFGEGAKIDSSVIEFIAFNVTKNVRELEGAYKKVIFTQMLLHKKLTVEDEELKDILRDLGLENNKEKVDFDYLASIVCQYYNITKEELFSKTKSHPIVDARHIFIYLVLTHTNLKQVELSKKMGNFDHTKILYSYKKITEYLKFNDEETKKVIKYVDNIIASL